MKFYKNAKNSLFVLPDNQIICSKCGKFCYDKVFLKIFHYNKPVKYFACSPECAKSIKDIGHSIINIIHIVERVDPSFTIVFPEQLQLGNGKLMSGFDAVYNITEGKTNDMTRLAGRESFEGASVGSLDYTKESENDKLESFNDGMIELSMIRDSKPVSDELLDHKEEEKKKLLD